jgi:hypothetical protein
MKKIKKFKKKELKEFVCVNDNYNIDANYHKFLCLRHVDDFSYDTQKCIVMYNGHEYNAADCAELLQEVNESGIKLTSEAKMNRTVKSFCLDMARDEIEEQKLKAKQEKEEQKLKAKQEKEEQLINGPKQAHEYVETNYSDMLSLSTTSGRISYNGQYSQSVIENLINELTIPFLH